MEKSMYTSSLISVTRLHVRSARYLLPFFRQVLDIHRQVQRAQGFLGGKLLYQPGATFWTMTMWTDEPAMRTFQTADAHGAAMPNLLEWCDEASVAHWVQQGIHPPDWRMVHQCLVGGGRLSRVHHPSPAQIAGQIARPPWSPFQIRLKPEIVSRVKTQTASSSRIIHVPPQTIYRIIADYRSDHPAILPERYFRSLEVEAGGYGAGTIVRFQMRLPGRTQRFRTLITEPAPGRVLIETDLNSGTPTTFTLSPLAVVASTQVTISTGLKNRGAVEAFFGKLFLQKVYRAELDLLANLAEEQARAEHFSAEVRSTRST
jgi:hypothetical protein